MFCERIHSLSTSQAADGMVLSSARYFICFPWIAGTALSGEPSLYAKRTCPGASRGQYRALCMRFHQCNSLPESETCRFSSRPAPPQAAVTPPGPQVRPKPPAKPKKRLTWILGAIAAGLLILFWLINVGFIHLDTIRAGVLSRVAGICPDRAQAYTFLGEHYSTSGRTADAVEACEKLVQVEPEVPHAHVLLGDAYRNVSRPEEAIACYGDALELDPNCYEAHLGRGEVYDRLGRYPEAIKSYKQAVEIEPKSAPAYVFLGLVFSNQGRYEEAMQAFQQAKELDPEISEVQVLSGKAYLDAGLYEEAIECFRDVIATDQNHARAHYNLGRAYLRAGDRGLALSEQRILEPMDANLAGQLFDLIEQ